MKRWMLIGLWAIMTLSLGQAQDAPAAPLLWVSDGQLYRVGEDGVQAYTSCQPPAPILQVPHLSPDSARFVLLAQPPRLAQYFAANGGLFGGSLIATDLYLCEGESLRMLTEQGNDFAVTAEGAVLSPILRGMPRFSPDGQSLAWLELNSLDEQMLVIQNLSGGPAQVVPLRYPPVQGIPSLWPMWWGSDGILIINNEANPQGSSLSFVMHRYGADGTLLERRLLWQESEGGDFALETRVFSLEGQTAVAAYFVEGGWQQVGLPDGQPQPLPDLLEVYPLSAPEQGGWFYDIGNPYQPTFISGDYSYPNGMPVSISGYGVDGLALSPDGRRAAFVVDQLYVIQDGVEIPIPETAALVGGENLLAWGAIGWRIGR